MEKVKREMISDSCADCPARSRSAFASCDAAAIKSIDEVRKCVPFSEKNELNSKLDRVDGFYCIRSGFSRLVVPVSRNVRVARICGPGDLMFYGDWLTNRKHAAFPITGGSACFFPFARFLEIQKKNFSIAVGITEMLCKIIAIKDLRIASLENHDVSSRVAGMLLSLKEKFGKKVSNGSKIDLTLDRSTMATIAGTVPATLARVLTRFENDRVIFRDGRKIVIIDNKALNEIAFN